MSDPDPSLADCFQKAMSDPQVPYREEPPCCSTCRFWVPGDEPAQGGAPNTSEHGWGECRRYPPQSDVRARVTVWPFTTGEQGCGEHKPPSPPAA